MEQNSITALGPFWYRLWGVLACALSGRLRYYRTLVAQGALETGHYSSPAWRAGSGAWCMHHSATGTPRASGVYVTTSGERLATYSGPLRYWRMWMDRLRWDVARNIEAESVSQYVVRIMDAGWLGSNASNTRRSSYAAGLIGVYNRLPSSWMDYPAAWYHSKLLWWVVTIAIIAAVVYLIYRLLRRATR